MYIGLPNSISNETLTNAQDGLNKISFFILTIRQCKHINITINKSKVLVTLIQNFK